MAKLVTLITIVFIFQFSFGQDYQRLKFALLKDFPAGAQKNGAWVYNPADSNFQRIYKPEVNKFIPNYSFYKVRLTNFLGYHVNSSICLVLFDSARLKTLLAVPMWYSDIDEKFLELFIGIKFSDSSSIMKFTYELKDLMIIGSTGQFENIKYSKDHIMFDLTYDGARGKEVWRQIEITISDNVIRKFISTNPKMKTGVIVE